MMLLALLLAEAIEVSPEALIGGGGLGGALLYVGIQIGRIAGKFGALVDGEKERRKAEDKHRRAQLEHQAAQRKHWEIEEALLRQVTAVPQHRPDTGSHTPIQGIPIGQS